MQWRQTFIQSHRLINQFVSALFRSWKLKFSPASCSSQKQPQVRPRLMVGYSVWLGALGHRCHNDILVHLNLKGYCCTSFSLRCKPKTLSQTIHQLNHGATCAAVTTQINTDPLMSHPPASSPLRPLLFKGVMKTASHMNPPKTAKQGTFGDDSSASEIFWICSLILQPKSASLLPCS